MTDRQPIVLTEQLFDVGSALIVATVAADGEPRACRASAWSLVDRATARVRVAVSADDPVTVANLEPGAPVAVTGADVATLRSIQLKGHVATVEEPGVADLDLVDRHNQELVAQIELTDEHPREIVLRFMPSTVLMVELLVDEAFDQTPGPGAGSTLRGGAA